MSDNSTSITEKQNTQDNTTNNNLTYSSKKCKVFFIMSVVCGILLLLLAIPTALGFIPLGIILAVIGIAFLFAAFQFKKINPIISVTEKIDNFSEYFDAKSEVLNAKKEHEDYVKKAQAETKQLEKSISKMTKNSNDLSAEIEKKKSEIVVLDNQILLQEFGLYTPVYNFTKSEEYKKKLEVIRAQQKEMISNDMAATYSKTWTVNQSEAKGRKMVKDNVKQILRSFNNECETLIDKAKFNNIESIRKRIKQSYETLNKLNSMMEIKISYKYLDLKLQELNLAYEYSLKKQEEKEAEKERRAQMRESAKLERELAEERKKVEKEQKHYEQALHAIEAQIKTSTDEKYTAELEAKKDEIMKRLDEIEDALENIDYRESNQKAGYVYVISNIGAFGRDVYKIGMTRRLDPMDRVDELGDASVPFNFDVHAMIFSDDAPALEAALHRAFDDRKVNMINKRREFFSVTLEEIEEVVKANFDKTVDFVKEPPAEQYRESLIIKNKQK